MLAHLSKFFAQDLKQLNELFKATHLFKGDVTTQRQQFYQEDLEVILRKVRQQDATVYHQLVAMLQNDANVVEISSSNNESLTENWEPDDFIQVSAYYDELIEKFEWQQAHPARLLLVLVIVDEMLPDFFTMQCPQERDYVDWGFVKKANGHFAPTGRTLLQLCLRNGLSSYQAIIDLFSTNHPLLQHQMIEIDRLFSTESVLSQPIRLSPHYHSQLISGKPYEPQYATDFPATLLTTFKKWEDLYLNSREEKLINSVRQWIKHYDQVVAKIGQNQMKGYRLLMYGASGTGKTLTAALLGKEAGKPVYRVNIANIVDKYVGETNKKLEQLFALADEKDWILFFDEADALFGKRTSTSSAQDRYANQEVSYLLYKMEEYRVMIFLATNQGVHLDEAFTRRFDTQVRYGEPEEIPRVKLWQHFFDERLLRLDPAIDLQEMGYKITCTGAWIEKFRNYCVLQYQALGEPIISRAHFLHFLDDFTLSHKVTIRGEIEQLLQ